MPKNRAGLKGKSNSQSVAAGQSSAVVVPLERTMQIRIQGPFVRDRFFTPYKKTEYNRLCLGASVLDTDGSNKPTRHVRRACTQILGVHFRAVVACSAGVAFRVPLASLHA